MQIRKLDHVNLRTTRLEEMIGWYDEILGMAAGWRPDFPFPGAWLYAGEAPFVHLVGIEGPPATGSETKLKLEHFAFSASGAAEFEKRLTRRGETFRKVEIADTRTIAFNVWDPDGNHIHVDFSMDE